MQDVKARSFDNWVVGALALLIPLSVVAMGSVAPWARSLLFVAVAGLVAAWLVGRAGVGSVRIVRHPVWLFMAAFFALGILTLVSWPGSVVSALQPGTAATHLLATGTSAHDSFAFSLSAYHTRQELMRLAILASVFFLVLQTVHTRRQVLTLIVSLLTVGVFEALYWFFEQFSGNRHIFWEAHRYASNAVTGTYLNKNHFAGLLEMVVPVVFCLAFTFGNRPGSRRPGPHRYRDVVVRLSAMLASRSFFWRLLLLGLGIVMAVAVLFSLSRAGIASMVLALGLLVLFSLFAMGCRRHAVAVIGLGLAVLVVASSIGINLVLDRVEDVTSGSAASWEDRFDLSRSALPYLAAYPLVGSGPGTFGSVFPTYQSGRFGNKWANFLHNDWLQLACEHGLVGAALVVGALVLLLVTIGRNVRRRRNRFSRWVTAGCLAGVAAMLVHSLFDYNLSRITANGIVFVMLLAVAYRASVITSDDLEDGERSRYVNIPLRGWPLRTGVVALAALMLVGAGVLAEPPFRADLAFNHYLATTPLKGETEDYFFLPVAGATGEPQEGREPRLDWLELAANREPDNPRHVEYQARELLSAADALVRDRARDTALRLLGFRGEDERALEDMTVSLMENIRPLMAEELAGRLGRAEALTCRAIQLEPTHAAHHVRLARVLRMKGAPGDESDRAVRRALALAPHKPSVLFDSGLHLLARARLETGTNENRREALACFRNAIAGDASYAGPVFNVLRAMNGTTEDIIAVTPDTRDADINLANALWAARDWENLLACLDRIDARDPDVPATLLRTQTRRCLSCSMRGQWRELADAVSEYRRRLRLVLTTDLAEARRLRRCSRHAEAIQQLRSILDRDWANAGARLEAAEIASLPCVAKNLPAWNTPLDHLFQLVLHHPKWSEADYQRVLKVLRVEDPRDESERRLKALVVGAGLIRVGHARSGIRALQDLAEDLKDCEVRWHLGHLVWYFIGRGHEQLKQIDPAVAAYREVLARVATHQDSLKRLVALGYGPPEEVLARVEPAVPFRVEFQGVITLLGYSAMAPTEAAGENGAPWFLDFYWRIEDRFDPLYRPFIQLLDESMDPVSGRDVAITLGDRAYPVHAPRSGEVVVTRVPFGQTPPEADYLRIGLLSADPETSPTPHLQPAWERRQVPARLLLRPGRPEHPEAGRP
jgi:O-antigen ligase/tetratricopeptide (TPR) repeat protein